MSSCCIPDQRSISAAQQCPGCGRKGTRVDPITPKALLTPAGLRRGLPPMPYFCRTPDCPIAYFDNSVPLVFEETLLTVRVHVKHAEDVAVPVCYCFGHTPESIAKEIEQTGTSAAGATIIAEVKAGHCACEVKNPKGSCCLGDVAKIEQRESAKVQGPKKRVRSSVTSPDSFIPDAPGGTSDDGPGKSNRAKSSRS